MLVRAYRFTDKLGVVFLKSSVALVDVTLDGLSMIWQRIAVVLALLGGILWFVLRPIFALFGLLGGFILRSFGIQTRQTSRAGAGSGSMARRAAREQMQAGVTEDPLRAQNRVLSLLTVALLAVLVGVVLWATNPARGGGSSDGSAIDTASLFASSPLAPTAPAILQTTPVPTTTPLPPILEARGTMAYVVRELGQTDIWAVPVGSRTPIRITNSAEDDRDPAWSPDGRKLAYASRQDGNWELYIYDTVTGNTTRMTYDLSFQGAPTWSSDGDWLAYESYQGNNLDIYVMRIDGSQQPIRLPGNSDAPDYSPSWSPDGRKIAFVSLRDGNQDIYVFSLDDQSVVNLTKTPDRQEDYPTWSPDGRWIAYSALDQGQEKVFVISTDNPDAGSQVINVGRTPAWSPDGTSIVAAVDSTDGTQLIVNPFSGAGVGTAIIPVPLGSTRISWTAAPLPQALVNAGGLAPARTEPLFVEQADKVNTDPPYRLNSIAGVTVEQAVLSDRVNDSFNALRDRTNQKAGWDFLGKLDDAFWSINRPPQPGEERRNWLMTGRAFSLTRNAIVGFPPPLEVQREDIGVDTYWRVFVRVSDDAQSGQLGEPLRHLPWDFASRTAGDVQAYDEGGKLRDQVPDGYYVDFTQIAADFGWQRVPAGSDWRANSNTINYWSFQKRDGLTWFEAMRELYTEGQLGNFAPTVEAPPSARPTVPPLTIVPSVIAGGSDG